MSGFNRFSPLAARAAPSPDTSAVARGLANLAGGAVSLGAYMAEDAAGIQRANIRAITNEAQHAYGLGLDELELELDGEPDPEKMRERFVAGEAALRDRVLSGVSLPDEARVSLEQSMNAVSLPAGRRVKQSARRRVVERAEATRTLELDRLVRRASTTADPADLAASRRSIEELLIEDVRAGSLSAGRAKLLRAEAEDTIGLARLERAVAGYGDLLATGEVDAKELTAMLRADAAGLGISADELDARLTRSVAQSVESRIEAGAFGAATVAIEDSLAAGALDEGQAASLAGSVRRGMAAEVEGEILRGVRAIRSGRSGDVEADRASLQALIDSSAWLTGESRALELTIKLNEASRDDIAARSERERRRRADAASADWLVREQSNLTSPGAGGYPSFRPETVLVDSEGGEPVEVKLTEQQKRTSALEWGYEMIDRAVGSPAVPPSEEGPGRPATGLMSDDPREREAAWESPILATLREMPITGLYAGEKLEPAEAASLSAFARLAYTIDTGNTDPAIAEQIGQAMAAGKATLTRLRSQGGQGPEGTAFESWFTAFRNLKALGQNGESDYFDSDASVFFNEIDRQYTYNLETQGEFWPSVMAAEDAMRRRVSEGYRPFKPTDKQVRKAARRAAGVGWWTAKANGIANAFVFVGNLGAEASRTTGEVQRGLAAEAGRGERAFDYFPTDYTERVRNPADVEQYMRAMLTVNASGPDEVEPAIDRAVAAFKRSHVVVNGWAVNIGDGGTADAVMRATDSAGGKSQMDRAIASFFEKAGGVEKLGVELDDLIMRPEDPAEAGAGWWVVVERSTGAAVGDPVNGLNRVRIEELAERARRRLYENAAERSRSARREREKDAASDADIPIGGTLRRFSLDAAEAMSPSGGLPVTPEQIDEMRRLDERLPRGRDADAIKKLRERGGVDG